MMSQLSHPPLKIGKSLYFDLKIGMLVNKNAMNLTKKEVTYFVE